MVHCQGAFSTIGRYYWNIDNQPCLLAWMGSIEKALRSLKHRLFGCISQLNHFIQDIECHEIAHSDRISYSLPPLTESTSMQNNRHWLNSSAAAQPQEHYIYLPQNVVLLRSSSPSSSHNLLLLHTRSPFRHHSGSDTIILFSPPCISLSLLAKESNHFLSYSPSRPPVFSTPLRWKHCINSILSQQLSC